MESHIKIKASTKQLEAKFDCSGNKFYMLKYFERKRVGLYFVILRHADLEEYLSGTFTFANLDRIFKED